VERVEQEDAATTIEVAGDPDGEGNTDGQIAEGAGGDIHGKNFREFILNLFKK
jgi:hypothetical protein